MAEWRNGGRRKGERPKDPTGLPFPSCRLPPFRLSAFPPFRLSVLASARPLRLQRDRPPALRPPQPRLLPRSPERRLDVRARLAEVLPPLEVQRHDGRLGECQGGLYRVLRGQR